MSSVTLGGLSAVESVDLVRCELVIRGGLEAFVEVGRALAEIRERRLYRGEYKTFEGYLRAKWSMGRGHASRMIGAAEVVQDLSPTGDVLHVPDTDATESSRPMSLPASERQARPLTKLARGERAPAWGLVIEASGGGPVTAADVERVVREVRVGKGNRKGEVAGGISIDGEPAAGCANCERLQARVAELELMLAVEAPAVPAPSPRSGQAPDNWQPQVIGDLRNRPVRAVPKPVAKKR